MNGSQTSAEQDFPRSRHELNNLLTGWRDLWLAGLGLAAEADRQGRAWFDELVERGRPIEEQQRKAVETAAQQVQGVFREIGKLCQDQVQHESKTVLKRFGMMTRDDVRILSARLDTLAKKIDELAART